VPGMKVPQHVRDRMAGLDKSAALKEGRAIALELIERILPTCAGIYLVPPFNRVDYVAEVIEGTRKLIDRRRPGAPARR